MIQLNSDSDFKQAVSEGLVLVSFTAEWCVQCKLLDAELEQIKDITIVEVDIDDLQINTANYGITGVPTLALFKDGEMIGRTSGNMPKEAIVNWIQANE